MKEISGKAGGIMESADICIERKFNLSLSQQVVFGFFFSLSPISLRFHVQMKKVGIRRSRRLFGRYIATVREAVVTAMAC